MPRVRVRRLLVDLIADPGVHAGGDELLVVRVAYPDVIVCVSAVAVPVVEGVAELRGIHLGVEGDFLSAVLISRGAQHTEEGFCGGELVVVADLHEIVRREMVLRYVAHVGVALP